jgi:hypothetical protein
LFYFIGDYYWSNWEIVKDKSLWPKVLFKFTRPQLTAQAAFPASLLNYYPDYWLAFHFPPGNKTPISKQFSGEMAVLQKRYLQKFVLRDVNSNVKNKSQLCRPYSQFVIDMISDTIQKYQSIKTDPDWKKIISNCISHERYISDEIPRDKFALIFLGIRLHILADTWAHQDFTGFNDKSINHIDGDVFADVNKTGTMEKALFTLPPDNDNVYAPNSGKGHGNLGHYPDYSWLTINYPAAWRVNSSNITRNNPQQFKEAWNEMASVIALCLNKQSNISMPDNVAKDITMRFDLDPFSVSAPIKCEKNWAANSAKNIANVIRWKDKVKDQYIGVTHGLPITRWGNIWIENGSILHMYELASLMHFSWCERWAKNNLDYGWVPSTMPNDTVPNDTVYKGNLYWYCNDGWQNGAEKWTGSNLVGHGGWQNYKSVFASSNGIIYGITF